MKVKGIIILLLVGFVFAGNKTKLQNAVVYTSGAYLTHETSVDLSKGNNNIVLSGLANGIVDNSIQIKLGGKASILTINKNLNYLQTGDKNPEIKKLEVKLKALNKKNLKLRNTKNVISYERQTILENLKVGGEKGTSVFLVKEMTKFVRTKMTELSAEEMKIDSETEKNNIEIKKIENQLNEVKQKYNKPSEELSLDIYSAKKQRIKIFVSYMIYKAGWMPQYDVRAEKLDAPVVVNLKAGIWQRSGLDWNNVDITLSTNRPENQTKPELYPWYIDFIREQQKLYKSRSMKMETVETAAAPMAEEMLADAGETALFFEANESLLSIEYKPNLKIKVPADGKKHFVELQKFEMKAEYSYYAAPKVNKDVFLIARTKDFKKIPLLPGEANIYFENAFVGNTYFNPATTEEFYPFALGRDKNVIVKRKQLKDFTEDKFLSSDVERYFGYELLVKNNRKNEISIVIEDNLPISRQEDIQVEIINKGKAELNTREGKLKWDLKLKAGSDYKDEYKFSVRYPKNRRIKNL